MTAGVMTKFRIHELSGVDRPAQAGALAVIMKRDFTESERKEMAQTGQAMPDGSFPIANEADLHNSIRLYGHAKDPAKAKAHIIARAKAMGCTGALPDGWVEKSQGDGMNKELRKALGLSENASDADVIAALVKRDAEASKEVEMAEEAAKKAKMLADEEAEKRKKAEKAYRKASMTAAEREHCKDMSDDDADDFMAMPAEDRRKKMMGKSAGGHDETIIVDGATISKAEVGPGMFAFMKSQLAQNEALRKSLAVAESAAADVGFAKRAAVELPYVPGTIEERAAMLKGIAGIADEPTRAAVQKALEVANSTAQFAFRSVGAGGGVIMFSKAADEIEKGARAMMKAEVGLTFEKAYDKFVTANPELYAKAEAERRAAAKAAAN